MEVYTLHEIKEEPGIRRMKKSLAFVLLMLLLSAMLCAAEAEEPEQNYTTMYVLCKPNSFVNVREFPKKNGKPGPSSIKRNNPKSLPNLR